MTIRPIALAVLAAALAAGAAAAAAAEGPAPFTKSVPLDTSTATVTVDFHDGMPGMVACTPEQAATIGARAAEHLDELLPVLYARLLAKKDGQASGMTMLLDAACYEGGIMALGGYGRGEDRITLAYEESTDGETWGPVPRTRIVIGDPATPEGDPAPAQ